MAADFEHLLATRYSELIRSRLQSDLVSEMCRTLLEPWLVGMLQSWRAPHTAFATLATLVPAAAPVLYLMTHCTLPLCTCNLSTCVCHSLVRLVCTSVNVGAKCSVWLAPSRALHVTVWNYSVNANYHHLYELVHKN